MKRILLLSFIYTLILTGCSPTPPINTPEPLRTTALELIPTFTHTLPPMPSATPTATITPTPTETLTPTITFTPSITPSPTYDFPDVTVKMQAHCRYGPSTGYLHAADLYTGDTGTVGGRNLSGTWLYIKFDKLHYYCWAAASVVDVVGDIFLIYPIERKLPHSDLYGPPKILGAVREKDQVTITWKRVDMTEDDDRGYMIEANLCLDGTNKFVVVATENTTYTFTDGSGCQHASYGLLYTVEKHGYSDPVEIPWPAP